MVLEHQGDTTIRPQKDKMRRAVYDAWNAARQELCLLPHMLTIPQYVQILKGKLSHSVAESLF